jgi:hypothetical protein
MKRDYGIFTIAATPAHARECGIPVMARATVKAQTAQEALRTFLGESADAAVFIPHSDYRDTAIAYEAADPKCPLQGDEPDEVEVWLATLDTYIEDVGVVAEPE